MSLPDSIAGFQVILTTYTSPSSSTTVTHILYARAHVNPKKTASNKPQPALPDGRTLFLVNVPPDATERELITFFKHAGTIERVVFDKDIVEQAQDPQSDDDNSDSEDEGEAEVVGEGANSGKAVEGEKEVEDGSEKPRKRRKVSKDGNPPAPTVTPLPSTAHLRTLRKTGQSAHIIFLDSSSLTRLLSSPSTSPSSPRKPRPWPTSPAPYGLLHYKTLHTLLRPPLSLIASHSTSSIALYDHHLSLTKARLRKESKYAKGEAIVDEDGFTLVTRGGAYGQSVGGGVGVASRKFVASAGAGAEGVDGKEGRGAGVSGRKKKRKGKDAEKEGFYAFQTHEKKRKGAHTSISRFFLVVRVSRC